MLDLTPSKLFPCYLKGRQQGLTVEGVGGIYEVSSFKSKPGGKHRVDPRLGVCSCPAKSHCTHLALAAYEDGAMVFSGMSDEALECFEAMKRRLLTDLDYRARVAARYVIVTSTTEATSQTTHVSTDTTLAFEGGIPTLDRII